MNDRPWRNSTRQILPELITLHQLEVFETTARYSSFTRAAEALSLTQPTVSTQVKQLSKAIGMPVFEQIGKRLYLTEVGEEVLKSCQSIFDRLAQLEDTVADLRGIRQKQLSLSTTTTAKYFISRFLLPFCQTHTDVNVLLEVEHYDEVLSRLDENLDDFYILSQVPERNDIKAIPFLCNPLAVVAPANHPLANAERIALDALAGEPFILREPGSEMRSAIDQLFHQHHLTVNIKMQLDSDEAIKQAVNQGFGLSILSLHSLTCFETASQLTVLNVEGFPLHQQWHVIFPKQNTLSHTANLFLEHLLQESQEYCQMYLLFNQARPATDMLMAS